MQWWTVLVIAFAMLAGVPDRTTGGTAANPEVEPQAVAMLEGMATVLAQAERFSVTVGIGYDVAQDSGQTIEFGETRTIVMRRPDHIRIEAVSRDGSERGFIFDSKALAVFDVDGKVYATVDKSGTVDEAIGYVVNDLGMQLPPSDLLSTKLPETLRRAVQTARYVGQETIMGE